jgi:hypothetical protein
MISVAEERFSRRVFKALASQDNGFRAMLKREIDPLAESVGQIYNIVDGIAKRLDDDNQERGAMSLQLDRVDEKLDGVAAADVKQTAWIGQLAEHTGTELQPEQ